LAAKQETDGAKLGADIAKHKAQLAQQVRQSYQNRQQPKKEKN